MEYHSKTPPENHVEIKKIRHYALIAAVIWTILLFSLFFARVFDSRHIPQAMISETVQESLFHSFIWLVGLGLIWLGTQKVVRTMTLLRNDLKKAEKMRQMREQQLHQAQELESLGAMAGVIAHDFNNILSVITGYCYMAKNELSSEEEYKDAFHQIEIAGNNASDLCRQMLTYAGKCPLVQTRVNLWLLINEVVKITQADIKKNVTIKLDLKHDVPEIFGDTDLLQQILISLIINAAESIGEANGTITVVLKETFFEVDQTETDTFGTIIQAGSYACIEVTDTGCGMDENTIMQIFKSFFTIKSTGRGSGMSTIRGIVKAHDGLLQITSSLEVGTTFRICFPVLEHADV